MEDLTLIRASEERLIHWSQTCKAQLTCSDFSNHIALESSHYRFARLSAIAAALASLAACASLTQVAPGTPLTDIQARFGPPDFECALANGGRRVIWTQQPMGQYAWGANVGADGRIERIMPLLTDAHFNILRQGQWTAAQVRCEFGPPARIEKTGLGEKREAVWSYRYKENHVWNSLMHVYMGRDGNTLTRLHPGPDPMYEAPRFMWR